MQDATTATRYRFPEAASGRSGPLAGLRVIEVSSFVAAPLGGMTLGQLGADVIRIDPPGGAADRDRWPVTASGESLYWAGLNKGKRSLVADFRSEEGRQVVRDLVAAAPLGSAVVLTNVVGRDWLGYEALSAVCPDLIHVEIRGNADGSAAVDYTVNAGVGFPLATGPAGWAGPVNHVLPAWDVTCGLYAALGIAAAALRRNVDGSGDSISIALSDVALATAGNLGFLAEAEVNRVNRPRIGNHLYGNFARDFTCVDGGRIMVVALTARHWQELVTMTGVAAPVAALEGALEADFSRDADRYEHREALAGLIQRWFGRHSTSQVVDALERTSVLWERYRTFAEVVDTLRTTSGANPMMSVVDQPEIGRYLAPASPLAYSSTVDAAVPAPLLGEHTVDILRDELGYVPDRVEALRRSGAVSVAGDRGRGR